MNEILVASLADTTDDEVVGFQLNEIIATAVASGAGTPSITASNVNGKSFAISDVKGLVGGGTTPVTDTELDQVAVSVADFERFRGIVATALTAMARGTNITMSLKALGFPRAC